MNATLLPVTAYQPPPRTWFQKFADALGGIRAAMRGQCSFHVHLPAALAVAVLAIVLRVTRMEACLLALCVGAVLGAELFNTALERLAKAITREYDDDVRLALNMASGAVLVVALFAAAVGLIIFLPHLLALAR